MTTPTTEAPKDLIGFLDFYLVKKAPFQIPDGGREWIVKFGPWITVVLLILTLPILLFALGLGAIFMPVRRRWLRDRLRRPHAVRHRRRSGLMIAALPGLFNAQDGRMAASLLLAARQHRLQPAERQSLSRFGVRADRAVHPVSGAALYRD